MINQSITSANAVFMLTIPGVRSTPVRLEGFAVDDEFELESTPKVEMHKGIDGLIAQGYLVDKLRKMTIHFMPNSPSLKIFDDWARAMDTLSDAIPCTATIFFPGSQEEHTLTSGGLTAYKSMADTKKVRGMVPQEITWGKVVKVS